MILNGVMSNRNSLISLNLGDNKISDDSCEMICAVIEDKTFLKEFYLSWNIITSKGSE
jgi:hypothetical protein